MYLHKMFVMFLFLAFSRKVDCFSAKCQDTLINIIHTEWNAFALSNRVESETLFSLLFSLFSFHFCRHHGNRTFLTVSVSTWSISLLLSFFFSSIIYYHWPKLKFLWQILYIYHSHQKYIFFMIVSIWLTTRSRLVDFWFPIIVFFFVASFRLCVHLCMSCWCE